MRKQNQKTTASFGKEESVFDQNDADLWAGHKSATAVAKIQELRIASALLPRCGSQWLSSVSKPVKMA